MGILFPGTGLPNGTDLGMCRGIVGREDTIVPASDDFSVPDNDGSEGSAVTGSYSGSCFFHSHLQVELVFFHGSSIYCNLKPVGRFMYIYLHIKIRTIL